jgi:serine protease Do
MKRIFFGSLLCLSAANPVFAQKTPAAPVEKPEKKEIVIEKKEGESRDKMVIVIDNGEVTINGKPAREYRGSQRIVIDDDIVINGNSVRIPGKRNYSLAMLPKAFLGVSTKKGEKGAEITEVLDESAAERAGLKKGDVITSVGEYKVSDSETLLEAVRKYKPKEEVDLAYLRNGKAAKVKVKLGESKSASNFEYYNDFMDDFATDFRFNMAPPMPPRAPRMYGFGENGLWMYRDDRPKFGLNVEDNPDGNGAIVESIEPESNAAKAGLQKGDIVVKADDTEIKTVDDLKEALVAVREKNSVALSVLRSGKLETIVLRVPKKIKSAEL